MNLLTTVRELFLETLDHLSIHEVMRTCIRCQGETLHIGDLSFPLQSFRRIVVISIGKAAAPMCDMLLPTLDPALEHGQTIQAIVVGATTPQNDDARVRFFPGSHPFPSQTSIDAADAILQLLATCDEHCLVLFLISGGASAMVEKPLDSTHTLEDVILFHRSLVRSGLPITQMNALRKHYSLVKGGRLAVAAQGATQCTLLVSDVPENVLHTVGSGPSLPDPATREQCLQLIAADPNALGFSDKLRAFFADPNLEETPKEDHPAFRNASWLSLLSSNDLCEQARKAAVKLGFHVVVDNSCDDWDYRNAASYLLNRLQQLRLLYPRVCLLTAGEVSVQIPSTHGIGGRNQQFVLECASLIAEKNLSATVLSGGSDGIDGTSPAAGAVCDETTLARAADNGLDVAASLASFDAFTLFNALGDAIITGPTGNNVRDLRILLSAD
jgi:glycerate 2-kinase